MLIIDRIEEDLAICEKPDRSTVAIPLAQLPPGLREGDCLQETDSGYTLDPAETACRRARNRALFQSLLGE